jgi:hypothetical protein
MPAQAFGYPMRQPQLGHVMPTCRERRASYQRPGNVLDIYMLYKQYREYGDAEPVLVRRLRPPRYGKLKNVKKHTPSPQSGHPCTLPNREVDFTGEHVRTRRTLHPCALTNRV